MKILFSFVGVLSAMAVYGQVAVFEVTYTGGGTKTTTCTTNNLSVTIVDVGSYSTSIPSNYLGGSVIIGEVPVNGPWAGKIYASGGYMGNGSTCANGSSASIPSTDISYTLSSLCQSYEYTSGTPETYKITVRLNIYIKDLSIGGTPPGNYCANTPIELIPNSGFPTYHWQYQIADQGWTNFTPTLCRLGPKVCFTLQNLFGTNNLANSLDKPIYFRYWLGDCDPGSTSVATGAFNFYAPPPSISTSSTPPTCPNGNGSILTTIDSPLPGVRYVYSLLHNINNGSLANVATTAANATFFAVPGTYRVKVEASSDPGKVSCFAERTQVIESPPAFSITPHNILAPTCVNGNDGRVTVQMTNGVAPFTWSLGTADPTTAFPPAAYYVNATAGQHTLNIKDNCGTVRSTNVNIPASTTPLSANISPSHPTCQGNGIISVTTNQVGSYNANYSYALSVIGSSNPPVTLSDDLTTSFTNLWDNHTYQLTITSPNNCVYTSNIDLNPPPSIEGSFTAQHVSCHGGSNGAISFIRQSGSNDLTFTLNGQVVNPSSIVGSEFIFQNYSAGSRMLRVVDNCLTETGATQNYFESNIDISQPLAAISFSSGAGLVFDGQILPVACAGGTAIATIGIDHAVGATTTSLERKANATDPIGVPVPSNDNTAPFTLVNLTPGYYEFEVQDACQAISMEFQVVGPSTPIMASITKLIGNAPYHLACNESTNGQLTIAVSGGSPGLNPAYQIELLDGNNYVMIDNVHFASNEWGTISGASNVAEGVAHTISGLRAHINYTVRITDYNNNGAGRCSQTFNVGFFSAPPSLTIDNIDHSDLTNEIFHGGQNFVQCRGQANINVVAGVTGGNAPYNVTLQANAIDSWPANIFGVNTNVVDNTAEFNGLGANFYRVIVQDQRGCNSMPQYFQISEATAPVQVTGIAPSIFAHGGNTVCHGDENASITISTSGGVQPYTYRLQADDGSSDRVVSNLYNNQYQFSSLPAINADETPITYTVHLQDVLGCIWTATNGVERNLAMSAPDPVTVQFEILSRMQGSYEIPCHGDHAEFAVSSDGGEYGHEILIINSNNPTLTYPGQITTTEDVITFSIPAGEYLIDVTDNLGCRATTQAITIDEPPTHVQLLSGAMIPPPCIGGDDGSISVSATNGVAGPLNEEYRFLIRKIGNTDFDVDTISGLSATFTRPADFYAAQEYETMVIDSHGCTNSAIVSLPSNPSSLTLTSLANASPSCYGGNNGSIQVAAANYEVQSGEYLRFMISGGHLGTAVVIEETTQDTFTFQGLEGTDVGNALPYEIWVEDSRHCVDTAHQYLANELLPSFLPVTINLTESVRPTCFNWQDGSLSIAIAGGVAPYQYSLNGVDFIDVNQSGQIALVNLASGEHPVFIRDSNFDATQPACLTSEIFTVEPGRFLNLITSTEPVHCKNGNSGLIDLSVIIENKNQNEFIDESMFTYSWVHNNVSSGVISTQQDLNSLSAGSYTVNAVYEPLGCQNQKTVNVLEPAQAFQIADVKIINASCGRNDDGRAVISSSGGWQNVLKYYRVDDQSWRAYSGNSFVLTGLTTGSHTLSISQSGFTCSDMTTFIVSATKLPLDIDTIIPPTCPNINDGQIFLSAGLSNVLYSEVNGEYQTANHFTGLSEGVYEFVARNVANQHCVSDTLQVSIDDPLDCGNGSLSGAVTTLIPVTCDDVSDGSATIVAWGGVPPYQYSVNGVTTSDELSGLARGNHTVVVTDFVGSTFEFEFTTTVLSPVEIAASVKNANCNDGCDGKIDLSLSGGSGNYAIQWSDNSDNAIRENLCVGEYVVTVSDARSMSCKTSRSIAISVHPPATVQLVQASSPTCHGGQDGKLFIQVEGGGGVFDFEWSNGSEEKDLIDVGAGEYVLNLTDTELGCVSQHSFTVPDGTPIEVTNVEITSPTCSGTSDGKIRLAIANATTPLVTWSNGMLGTQVSRLAAGNYDYSIIDSQGCTQIGTVEVIDPLPLLVTETISTPTCTKALDGIIKLAVQGGTIPYSVSWSHGPKQPVSKNLAAGTFSYDVRDRFGCSYSDTVSMKAPPPIEIDATIQHPKCYGSNNGTIALTTTGGTGVHTATWQNQMITPHTLAGLKKGTYTVMVEDEHACTASAQFTLADPLPLTIRVDRAQPPSCNNSADGSIAVHATGGTQPYSVRWSDHNTAFERNGLSAGLYEAEFTDANFCKVQKPVTLSSPQTLIITNEVLVNPLCHDETTGSIHVTLVGGTAPYKYYWNAVEGFSNQTQLAAGTYDLTVVDNNNCAIHQPYELSDPEKLFITGIPPTTVLCEGGTSLLSPAETWASYHWTGPNNFTSLASSISTGVQGSYTLEVFNEQGCPAKMDFDVEVSNSPIDSDFLMLSEAVVFEPIVFVDITMPQPESIQWLLPDDTDIIVSKKTSAMIELIFTRADDFEIGLLANLGTCVSTLTKTVTIGESETRVDNATGRSKTESYREPNVTIFPNPSNERIYLTIETPTEEAIVLKLFTLSANHLVFTETLSGAMAYKLELDLPQLNAGVHTLLYEYGGKLYSKKVVVMR